jgi:hypothetical protein
MAGVPAFESSPVMRKGIGEFFIAGHELGTISATEKAYENIIAGLSDGVNASKERLKLSAEDMRVLNGMEIAIGIIAKEYRRILLKRINFEAKQEEWLKSLRNSAFK